VKLVVEEDAKFLMGQVKPILLLLQDCLDLFWQGYNQISFTSSLGMTYPGRTLHISYYFLCGTPVAYTSIFVTVCPILLIFHCFWLT